MTGLNTLERDDLLRRIAWLNAEVDKIKRMLKGEQVGTARIADAAITNAKIKDLTWDKAQGGTATLGGLNNVDGVLEINDASSNQIGKWDKDGILINDGKLEIRNDGDVISIDSKGIVSTSNFTITNTNSASLGQTIQGTTADITGSSMTFTLARAKNTLFIASMNACTVESVGNSGNAFAYIDIDGSEPYANRMLWNSGNTFLNNGATFAVKTDLSVGSHTVKLRGTHGHTSGTGSSFYVYSFTIGYIQFGT